MPLRLAPGEEPLKGYRLLERLGRGGFGEVWKVEAPGGLLKAMKFVFGDLEASDEDSRPAEQELKALKRVQTIRHPYILSLERYDIIEGQLMIVMELADRNLWDRYRECRGQGLPGIPRDELLRYLEEAAEALDLMNNYYQIQHLDIKPQNLFLVFNHVKVGDFGLAKLLERERATVTGGVTPVYAAPETFEGYVTRFSDQYSLAIVFQELLTGIRPFAGANTRQLLMQHISGVPDIHPLPLLDKAVISRGLAKKPDERWPSCTDMIKALKRTAGIAPAVTAPRGGNSGSGATGHPGRREAISAADSNQLTRVQLGAVGDATFDPAKTQTPMPANGARGSGKGTATTCSSMPQLVTVGPAGTIVPRLITTSPSADGPSPAITLHRPLIFQTARMNSLGIAPPEKSGTGALFPALIVGVGHLGRIVLESLRCIIQDRYGSAAQVPNVRLLAIDTDPEASAEVLTAAAGALTPKEVVLARLNRPTHYLQRESLMPVEQWLPPGSLYKISRNPGAADGVRAFGRLALFDNYRLVAQRVRQEIESFLTDESLTVADESTHLGLRSNRPRAYVVAGLGGGTGGGMFIDLAYLIRQELRGVGYSKPEVSGIFLLPPANKNAPRSIALGNAYASLTELYHFQAKKSKYLTTFDKAEAPIQDNDAPFVRAAVLQLPKAIDPKGRGLVAARAARALYDEILTPAGRVIDEVRDVYRNAFPSSTPTCQSFGLYRLTWPRPEVLAAATRRFAQRLFLTWTGRDAAALRDPIGVWLEEQWAQRKLGFEELVERFDEAARAHLQEEPDAHFDAMIEPLRVRSPSSAKLDGSAACAVLDRLLKLVGRPSSDSNDSPGTVHPALAARYEAICKEGETQLATMAVTFIEQPQYRLGGAEEAVRQIAERLKRQIETLEPMLADMTRELKVIYTKMFQTIGGITNGTVGWKGSAEALELLRAYPRKRLKLHVLEFAIATYRKLLGSTPEYLRDIAMCRQGLADLSAAMAVAGAAADPTGPGQMILPEGCATLDEACDRFLAGIDGQEVLDFDRGFQKEVARKFRGLAAVCLKPLVKGPHFRELLQTRSREFLDSKLDATEPSAVFFRHRTGGPDDYPMIAKAHAGASPEIPGYSGKAPDEAMVLAAPAGETGDRFRALVAAALPGTEFTWAPLPDDIVFHRECPRLELAELPQLGDNGKAAADALAHADHPPHSRVDVTWHVIKES